MYKSTSMLYKNAAGEDWLKEQQLYHVNKINDLLVRDMWSGHT